MFFSSRRFSSPSAHSPAPSSSPPLPIHLGDTLPTSMLPCFHDAPQNRYRPSLSPMSRLRIVIVALAITTLTIVMYYFHSTLFSSILVEQKDLNGDQVISFNPHSSSPLARYPHLSPISPSYSYLKEGVPYYTPSREATPASKSSNSNPSFSQPFFPSPSLSSNAHHSSPFSSHPSPSYPSPSTSSSTLSSSPSPSPTSSTSTSSSSPSSPSSPSPTSSTSTSSPSPSTSPSSNSFPSSSQYPFSFPRPLPKPGSLVPGTNKKIKYPSLPSRPKRPSVHPKKFFSRPDENYFVDLSMVTKNCDTFLSRTQECMDYLRDHEEEYLTRRQKDLPPCDEDHPMYIHAYWRGYMGPGLIWILKSFLFTQRLECARYVLWTEGNVPLDLDEIAILVDKERKESYSWFGGGQSNNNKDASSSSSSSSSDTLLTGNKYPPIKAITHYESVTEIMKMAPFVQVRPFNLSQQLWSMAGISPEDYLHYLDLETLILAEKAVNKAHDEQEQKEKEKERLMAMENDEQNMNKATEDDTFLDDSRIENMNEKLTRKNMAEDLNAQNFMEAKEKSVKSVQISMEAEENAAAAARQKSTEPQRKRKVKRTYTELKMEFESLKKMFEAKWPKSRRVNPPRFRWPLKMLLPKAELHNDAVTDSDTVRFILLYNYGGIYVDTDVLFLRDLRPWFFTPLPWSSSWSVHDHYNTALLKADKGHPTLARIIDKGIAAGGKFHPFEILKYLRGTSTHDHHLNALSANAHLVFIPAGVFDATWPWLDGWYHPFLPNININAGLFFGPSVRETEFAILIPSLGAHRVKYAPIRELRTLEHLFAGTPAFHCHGIGYAIEPDSWVDITLDHYECFLAGTCKNIYNETFSRPL